jgi:predicted RND superfamily exporter protein
VEAPHPGAFRQPRNLKALYDFERWLEAQPEVGDTSSLASLAEGVYRAYRAPDEAAAESLTPSELVERLLPMVGREDLAPFVDEELRRATILVRTGTASSAGLARLLDRVEWRASALPRPLVAQATGGAVLIGRAIDDISRSQTRSLGVAFVLILAILAWWARSLRDATVLLVPNVVPVLAYFGTLGWAGVPLDNSTALLACMLLGIAVDDTVHYADRFRDERRQSADPELCTARTLQAVGPAITYSTLVLVTALLLLSTSALRMLARFGAFGAAGLAFAWLLDVTLTPVLCLALAARRG